MKLRFKNSIIEEIEHAAARSFIERWHYSECVPTGRNIFFGWFIDGCLYAVADYGIGVNPYQHSFLARITGEDVTKANLLELKRLCRTEPRRDGYPLTAFLSKCHGILKRMGYGYVVSFSDPNYGHNGGIYKAANFRHLGQTNPEYHIVDADGNPRHRRYPYRYARRKGISIKEAREELGLSRVRTVPKDRWLFEL